MKSELNKELQSGKFVFTGEIEPVKTADLNEILETARILRGYVKAVNVTDNPAAYAFMNSLVPSFMIQERVGLETVYQVTCRDRNRLALQSDILAAGALGIKNILALTGDHTMLGDNPQAKPVFDLDACQLIYMIRRMEEGVDLAGNTINKPPRFVVGTAVNPGADPLEPEILKLEKKISLGIDFVQTQAVFDIEVAKKFLNSVSHIKVPILIGVCALRSVAMAEWMRQKCPGIAIPDEIVRRLKTAKERGGKEAVMQENIEIFGEFIKELKKTTHAAGCHVMAVGFEWVVPEIIKRAGITVMR
jgi:5,10-methylenetetrahydrofolate reductase